MQNTNKPRGAKKKKTPKTQTNAQTIPHAPVASTPAKHVRVFEGQSRPVKEGTLFKNIAPRHILLHLEITLSRVCVCVCVCTGAFVVPLQPPAIHLMHLGRGFSCCCRRSCVGLILSRCWFAVSSAASPCTSSLACGGHPLRFMKRAHDEQRRRVTSWKAEFPGAVFVFFR